MTDWWGGRTFRIPVAGLMGLIAGLALVLRWPPLLLAVPPVGFFLITRWFAGEHPRWAAALGLGGVAVAGVIALLWVRSHRISDGLFAYHRHGWAFARTTRGYVLVAVKFGDRYRPPGEPWLSIWTREVFSPFSPFSGDSPNLTPGVLLGPEVGDRSAHGRRGDFAWADERNPRLGVSLTGAIVPVWYLALLAAAWPLGWAARRRRGREGATHSTRGGGDSEPAR